MESKFINITPENINEEHICCAISDKKSKNGYQAKKAWLKNEIENNSFVFRKLNVSGKVFIEYVSAEKAWIPIDAPNCLAIGCFWVSGQYKGKGNAKSLMEYLISDAIINKKDGIVAVAGIKKFHFMSDTKWFLKNGFEICDKTDSGFCLLFKKINENAKNPIFKNCVKDLNNLKDNNKITVYYSDRCPFTDYHVNINLKETLKKRNINYNIVKINNLKEAQSSQTPATIFSMFYNDKFITTDISVCMDSRFDKITKGYF